jgi:hypothetical protein
VKLSPEARADLLAALQLREQLTNKALCRRFGVSRRTLVRLRQEMLDEHSLMAHFEPRQRAPAWLNPPEPGESKP